MVELHADPVYSMGLLMLISTLKTKWQFNKTGALMENRVHHLQLPHLPRKKIESSWMDEGMYEAVERNRCDSFNGKCKIFQTRRHMNDLRRVVGTHSSCRRLSLGRK